MIEQIAIGLISGVVFGLYGYLTKSKEDEPLDYKKLGSTVVVYGAAGAIVGYMGDPVTEEAIVEMTAYTVVLGESFDKLYSKAKRSME